MSKLLTTGEMIDRLKVEESALAYTFEGHEIPRMKITKNDAHSIMIIQPWEVLDINGFTLALKWRILPNYLSFEEVRQALKEDKTVIYHINNSNFIEVNNYTNIGILNVTFKEMILGNWTVKGESK